MIPNLLTGDTFYPIAFNKLNSTIDVVNSLSSTSDSLVSAVNSISSGLTGYVEIQNINNSLTGNIFIPTLTADNLSAAFIYLHPDGAPATYREGNIYWDSTNHTIAIETGEGPTIQVAQESHIRLYNDIGQMVPDASAVYINGSYDYNPTMGLATASAEDESYVVGLTTMNTSANSIGVVTVRGIVNDVNTLAWNVGDLLYISATGGKLTNIAPAPPLHANNVGIVLRSHGSLGKILVNIQRGHELYELHDVKIDNVLPNQLIIWDSTTGVWKNVNLIEIPGSITGSGSTNSIAYFTNSNSLSANSNFRYNDSTGRLSAQYIYGGVSPNGVDLSSTGLKLSGSATVWDTFFISPLSMIQSTVAPGLSLFKNNGSGSEGVQTYAFDSAKNEGLLFTAQLPKSYAEGTEVYPIVHWTPSVSGVGHVVWALEYTRQNPWEQFTNTTTVTASSSAYDNLHIMTQFPAIADVNRKVGSVIVGRLYRNGSATHDDYGNDAFLISLTFAYKKDTLGGQSLTGK